MDMLTLALFAVFLATVVTIVVRLNREHRTAIDVMGKALGTRESRPDEGW